MDAARERPIERPTSDVSHGVGLVGLAGLLAWLIFAREFPAIAPLFGISPDRGVLSGPSAALMGLVASGVPMVLWSVFVDKVHRRPSTGIDWSLRRPVGEIVDISITKLAGLWSTWALLGAFYWLGRWYWEVPYGFAMEVLGWATIPLFVLSIPYVLWLDRRLVEPRDASWHFGAMLVGRERWSGEAVKRHLRAWAIKGFFGAFMIAILPAGWAIVVETDLLLLWNDPVRLSFALTSLLFVFDVQIGAVGYLVTMKPLDAHIRSGNPFVAGWLAALICYPPFQMMSPGMPLHYHVGTMDWSFWLAGQTFWLWLWAGVLIALTAIYAWATVAFGLRFSNLTYRGVITHGPYAWTRHPAYLSKTVFWWFLTMPFMVTTGSTVDAVRNTVFLGLVTAIYYWRARTEEAHLLAEDPKYRDYYHWMAEHGAITARVRKMLHAIARRGGDGAAHLLMSDDGTARTH